MSPTLSDGDVVLIDRIAYWFGSPAIGDIVALKDPRDGKVLIKRILQKDRAGYFVQGDNKNYSTDSRVFGMIEKDKIVGKVIVNNDKMETKR